MSGSHDALVIPLWIGGHAYLTMSEGFCDVRDAASGEVLRRTPLAGADEAQAASAAALRVQPAWAALAADERAALLAAVADVLESYAGHFAGLLEAEAGLAADAAAADVAAAIEALRSGGGEAVAGVSVLALVADQRAALAAPLARLVPALVAGATVVVRPSPRAPSAFYALAEVFAEAGVPGGIVNVTHGDEAAVAGLCAATGVAALACVGEPDFVARVAAIAARHGRALA